MANNSVCRCPAYPWPHGLGRGRCDRTSFEDSLAPMTASRAVTIVEVLSDSNGVYLSRGNDGFYYVGLHYPKGIVFSTFDNPKTDFCSTADLTIATRYFQLHTGAKS